jgi:serine/threonine-protein kinase
VTDLLHSLQAALGSTYRLERELGGGGMSRVFVATETALGRRVVVKLLAPELGVGISADRFRREIQMAARLQHPHIVPLLAAGEVKLEGSNTSLLYFTMPFVEGESLRARLAKGPLPSAEAMRVLREVADALDYAHRQNIVHRDIKPDNILLSNGHAVVTDFGVAKALSTATSMDVNATATSVGTVIGTPAYMAPEQGAGDPDVGPAADIYALGVTTFEMLSGQTPFKGTTPRAILAAQLTSDAPALDTFRQDLAPALPPLVRRLLSKEPAARPSAAELLGLLEQVGTPAPGTLVVPPMPARRARPSGLRIGLIVAGAMAAVILGLRVTGLLPMRTLLAEGKFGSRDQVVLADMDVPGDSALGSALTEALRVDLSQSDVLQLLSSSQVRSTLRLMQQPEDRALGSTFAREVAVRSGAKGVIAGRIERVGGQMIVTLRLVSPESGDDLAAFRETAKDSTELLGALDKVTKQMRRRIGESLRNVRASPPMEAVTTSSLVALQKYSQAVAATNRGDYPQAQRLLEEALVVDTAFAMAWRKLGVVYLNQGEPYKARQPLTRAFQFRDRLPDRERYLTMGSYYDHVGFDNDKAVAAYRSALEIDSLDPVATNNLAAILGAQGDDSAAVVYYGRALAGRDSSPVALRSLVFALIDDGQLDGATAVQQAALTRTPGNIELQDAGIALAAARGDYATSERLARAASAKPDLLFNLRMEALDWAIAGSAIQGKLQRASADARDRAAMGTTSGRAGAYYGSFTYIATMDALYRNRPEQGKRLLDSVLAARPLSGKPPDERPYHDLAYTYALAGDGARARALLTEGATVVDTAQWRSLEPSRHLIMGLLALQEGRPAEAVRENHAALGRNSECRPCAMAALGRSFDAAGQPDSAIWWSEQYLASTEMTRVYEDFQSRGQTYRRLGELYEEKGDREKAANYYQEFIDLWRDADADLQPQVADVKKKLAKVAGEPK